MIGAGGCVVVVVVVVVVVGGGGGVISYRPPLPAFSSRLRLSTTNWFLMKSSYVTLPVEPPTSLVTTSCGARRERRVGAGRLHAHGVDHADDLTGALPGLLALLVGLRRLHAREHERGALDGSGGAAGLHFEGSVLGDLGGAVPRLADGERALGLTTTALVGQLRDRVQRRRREPRQGSVGVVDLGAAGIVGLDRIALFEDLAFLGGDELRGAVVLDRDIGREDLQRRERDRLALLLRCRALDPECRSCQCECDARDQCNAPASPNLPYRVHPRTPPNPPNIRNAQSAALGRPLRPLAAQTTRLGPCPAPRGGRVVPSGTHGWNLNEDLQWNVVSGPLGTD